MGGKVFTGIGGRKTPERVAEFTRIHTYFAVVATKAERYGEVGHQSA